MPAWYWLLYAVVIAALFAFAGWVIADSLRAATSHIKGSGLAKKDWEPFAVVGLVICMLVVSFTL
jgi:hypothetical protein